MRFKNIGFKILLVLFVLVPLTGCNNSRVDFEIALQDMGMILVGDEVEVLVTSFDEWSELDFSSYNMLPPMIELNHRYDELFFTTSAVIVFTFSVGSGGGIQEIQLRSRGHEIILEVIVERGLVSAPAFGIIILEISNENISETTTLSVTLNILPNSAR